MRDSTITVMPAAGLTLEEVGYPADHELAARALEARALRRRADHDIARTLPVLQRAAQRHRGAAYHHGTGLGTELPLITASGVFAADGLDRGTAVLLRASPIPVGSPRILDLGCGYGPSRWLWPCTVPARSSTRWT